MARNRQRAKERQARRKAQQGGGNDAARASARRAEPEPVQAEPAQPDQVEPDPIDVRQDPILGAVPPQDLGQPDEVLEYEQDLDAEHATDQEHFDPEKDHAEDADVLFPKPTKGSRKRPRIVEFLIAVWAELKRVEWPDRQQMITLTGVVLGFVLIAGGYLGLLDALAQKFVNAIL